jgi:hypothetical protein
VEAMRRLRKSTDRLRESSDYYGKWVVGLTIVLTILTALLVYKESRYVLRAQRNEHGPG